MWHNWSIATLNVTLLFLYKHIHVDIRTYIWNLTRVWYRVYEQPISFQPKLVFWIICLVLILTYWGLAGLHWPGGVCNPNLHYQIWWPMPSSAKKLSNWSSLQCLNVSITSLEEKSKQTDPWSQDTLVLRTVFLICSD